jgi:hypothetical protein
MIRIAISQAAFEAIARTLALGSVNFENATDEQGNRYVWLAPTVIDRQRAMRGPGESYSEALSHQAFLLVSTYPRARVGFNKVNGLDIRQGRPESLYFLDVTIADSDIASAISGISGVGEKPSTAGARTAWASVVRPVD